MIDWSEVDRLIDESDDDVMNAKGLIALEHPAVVAMVERELQHRRRMKGLTMERSMFRRSEIDLAEQYRRIATVPFSLGERRETTWGKATEGDHRRRIGMLEIMRAGIDRTIRAHEQAIGLLRQHDVRCLDDVPEPERVAEALGRLAPPG